ncbi:FAD-dependent oxidoreductase [uncultured Sneathiella sp.]|uniref:FAD-dependent oxidoreductase n=1 Tax=uncultured Sneathiella sp. TaxID=879315 RepID=UPI0030DB1494|tara:strand:- start:2865 stop:3935 length:1071 start_codon:yes stop_codon:yes gene_type:complete
MTRVLVVGAGPTGLTAAVELNRRGVEVEIIDKRAEGSGLSRAVGITPQSLCLLYPSGVTDKLLAEGIHFREARIYRRSELGLTLPIRATPPKYGYDFILGLPQDRTEALLRETVEEAGVKVRFSTELTGLKEEESGVLATVADGKSERYDYVLGADGVHSTTRKLLDIPFPGHDLPETWSIADVNAKDWPHPETLTLCQLSRGGVVVAVPLATDRYRVISNRPDALRQLPLEMDVTKIRREGEFTISIRQVPTYNRGLVYLAGDAAHSHSPVGGRGMNVGIADAAEFAKRLAEGSLEGYSAARHREGAKVIAGSERVRKIVTSTSPMTRRLFRLALKAAALLPPVRRKIVDVLLYG